MLVFKTPIKKAKRITIQKASRKIDEYKFLHQVADNMAGFIQGDINSGIKTFKSDVDFTSLASAMADGDNKKAFSSIPWKDFSEIEGIKELYQDTLSEAGERVIKTLPKVMQPKIRFDITNPRIVKWIDTNTSALVTNLTGESEKAVRDAIRRMVKISFDEALPPRKSAKLIQDIIGLNKPQEQAVFNFRQGLVDAGFKGDALESKVSALIKQKIKERSLLIAQTETIKAVNAGQQEVWNQGFERGLFDENTEKEWVVTPDDRVCPICANPKVDGQRVLWNKNFVVWLGSNLNIRVEIPHPSAHPRCRCAMKIVFH